jgi:hypothetical protein
MQKLINVFTEKDREELKKHLFTFLIFHGKSCESSCCEINKLKEKNNFNKALSAYLNEIKNKHIHKNSQWSIVSPT